MNRFVAALLLGVTALCACPIIAQEEKKPADPGYDAVRGELKRLRERAVAAVNKAEIEQLLKDVHSEVIFVAPALKSDLIFNRGHKGVQNYYAEMLAGPNPRAKSVTLDPKVKDAPLLIGGDTAIAWGTSQDTYKMSDGSDFTIPTNWTATLVKDNGAWKIAQCHISTDMFDNPIIAMAVRQTAYVTAGIAGAAGLFVGLLLGVIFRRKGSTS